MKALITGSGGFVGTHLTRELVEHGYSVVGMDICKKENTVAADLMSEEQVACVVKRELPDVIFHLAGQASVHESWQHPKKTFELNLIGTINLLESIKKYDIKAKVLLVGSSDQYGKRLLEDCPVSESSNLNPYTPYAVSKKAQEDLSIIYVRSCGMDIRMTRSFNHIGIGQKEGFMIPDFCAGIVRVENGKANCLKVGNLEAKRDFTHVSDVVSAYRLLIEQGISGEIYNVGSGTVYSAGEILKLLLKMARRDVPVFADPQKMRPSDSQIVRCDNNKLYEQTGWKPKISIEVGLHEVLESFRSSYR